MFCVFLFVTERVKGSYIEDSESAILREYNRFIRVTRGEKNKTLRFQVKRREGEIQRFFCLLCNDEVALQVRRICTNDLVRVDRVTTCVVKLTRAYESERTISFLFVCDSTSRIKNNIFKIGAAIELIVSSIYISIRLIRDSIDF